MDNSAFGDGLDCVIEAWFNAAQTEGGASAMATWKSEKLKPYGASIFDSLGGLARARAKVNLGQGFPDFDGPDEIKEAAIDAIRNGSNQYGPLAGVPDLLQALRNKYRDTTGIDIDPQSEITVLNGATEAMYCAIAAICNPGDEFIVFEPIYDTYVPTIQMHGGIVRTVRLHQPNFRFDHEELRAAFNPKTRAIIVNTPHNPTGRVFDLLDLELIRDLCVNHDVLCITDEVYEHLVWGENKHIIPVSLDGMRERTITISSTAKTYSLTGWKIGYAIAPKEATDAIRRMHQFISFCISTPFQHGMAHAVAHYRELIPDLVQDLDDKRLKLCKGLRQLGFDIFEPEGTYFILANFSAFSDKGDYEYAVELMESEPGVAVIPISGFYRDPVHAPQKWIRFCFAKKHATLDLGLERLALLRR